MTKPCRLRAIVLSVITHFDERCKLACVCLNLAIAHLLLVGIDGLVTDVAKTHAKILLVIDQNSAVDALIQRTRARGIIKGEPSGRLQLQYVLRKHDIHEGDVVISSGLDGVFPKGIRIGYVHEVDKPDSGIFQQLAVTPYADFEKLEEVLVVLDPPEQPELKEP